MPNNRNTWTEHGKEDWYIDPATEHHQFYKVLIKANKEIKTPSSAKFSPEHNEMPQNSSTERMLEVV